MTKESDDLAKALDLAEHAKRTGDEGERARLFALAVKYRELANREGVPVRNGDAKAAGGVGAVPPLMG